MQSVELTRQILSAYDCVILTTDRDAFDYELIRQRAKLIVDTRGVYGEPSANIVKAELACVINSLGSTGISNK